MKNDQSIQEVVLRPAERAALGRLLELASSGAHTVLVSEKGGQPLAVLLSIPEYELQHAAASLAREPKELMDKISYARKVQDDTAAGGLTFEDVFGSR